MEPIYVACLPSLDAEEAFERLMTELNWVHAGTTVPRKEYYVHEQGLAYTYGTGEFARTYESQPDHDVIVQIRNALLVETGVLFDVVFLNLYEHQHHHLGWHADDSPEMSDDHPIVSVSLGAERYIWWREIGSKEEPNKQLLESGSAFIMPPGMQDTHVHRIPKHDRPCGPRISLTFRKYVNASSKQD